jgi:hypothetical protein
MPVASLAAWPRMSPRLGAWVSWSVGAVSMAWMMSEVASVGPPWPGMSVVRLSQRYRIMPGGIRWVASRLYPGRLVPALYRCRVLAWGALAGGCRAVRQLRGKVRMMADVACFCGCFYSFDGGAGACPGCGEVATVTARPAAAGLQRGQQGQPGPAANGQGCGGPVAALREWAGLVPAPRPGSAMSDSTSGAGAGQESRA